MSARVSISIGGNGKKTGMIAGQRTVRAVFSDSLREFLVWWRDELVQLAPQWTKGLFARQDPVSTVQEVDGALRVKHQTDTEPVLLEPGLGPIQGPLGGARWVYLLPEDAVLLRQKWLPRAARAQARNIMSLQIPSETPFAIDEVYADTRIIDDDSSATEVCAVQGLAQRATVDGIVARALEVYGVRLAGVDVVDPGSANGRAGFNFMPVAKRPSAQAGRFSLNRALMIVLAGAALFAGWAWNDLQQRRIVSAEAALSAAEGRAQEALSVLAQISTGADAIALMGAALNDPLRFERVYGAAAALLPDGTWLEEFTYSRPVATITGLSDNSAALIEILEASEFVASARFVSPVVTDSQSGAERFRMEITFAPPMTPEAGK